MGVLNSRPFGRSSFSSVDSSDGQSVFWSVGFKVGFSLTLSTRQCLVGRFFIYSVLWLAGPLIGQSSARC